MVLTSAGLSSLSTAGNPNWEKRQPLRLMEASVRIGDTAIYSGSRIVNPWTIQQIQQKNKTELGL